MEEDVRLGERFGEGTCGSIVLSCFAGWSGRPVGMETSFFIMIHSQII